MATGHFQVRTLQNTSPMGCGRPVGPRPSAGRCMSVFKPLSLSRSLANKRSGCPSRSPGRSQRWWQSQEAVSSASPDRQCAGLQGRAWLLPPGSPLLPRSWTWMPGHQCWLCPTQRRAVSPTEPQSPHPENGLVARPPGGTLLRAQAQPLHLAGSLASLV